MAKKKIDIEKLELEQDDYEYEKKLAEEERIAKQQREERLAAEEAEREKQEREAAKERERQLAEEKLELLKIKSGLTDEESSEMTRKDEAYEKPHGWAAVANFWYHYKFIVSFSLVALIIVGFLVYTEATRKRDDLCVMVVTDNDLTQRTEEVEAFFEKYVDDLDGNGYVHVGVIAIPINKNLDPVTENTYTQKFIAQVQTGEGMIVITDSHTREDFMEFMKTDLTNDFPDNKYVNEQGFSFNSKVMAQELKYELMPNDVYMSIRFPQATMGMDQKEAEEDYAESFEVYKKIVDDITARCEETNDPGLTTEPIKYDDDDSSDTAASEISE
ncbi:hypothetical protein [Ruminococcus sp.]|uniref:hypothetical protein n=1 Tax=Ruminococcus sp. TaxID=41978 RepID=UPI0025D0BE22|nr:hypothetical protein [Ruminococcus sp.]MBQ8965271.1 hypothetical protein [Ruminococcus sp.]